MIFLLSVNTVLIGKAYWFSIPWVLSVLLSVLHSRTTKEDMDFYLAHADIVVVAIGKKHFLSDQPLKKTAIVVDVGISRAKINSEDEP